MDNNIMITFFIILCFGIGSAYAENDGTLWSHAAGWHMPLAIVPSTQGDAVLYVAQKTGGILILDETGETPRKLAQVNRMQLGGLDAMNLHLRGTTLYVALGDHFAALGSKSGLAIIDVTRPEYPVIQSIWTSEEIGHGAADIVVFEDIAFLAAMREGVHILNIHDPHAPSLLITILPDINYPKANPSQIAYPSARGVWLDGNRLYIANDAGGLRIYTTDDRGYPIEIGQYVNPLMPNKAQAYNNVVVRDELAYVAIDYCGLEILDITDASAIRQIGWWNPWKCNKLSNIWFNSPGHTNQLTLDNTGSIVYLSAGDSELVAIDVSNPSAPVQRSSIGVPKNGLGTWGMAIRNNTVYLTYINTPIPFNGRWAGIKAFTLNSIR